jgi:hypothetical protein
MDTYYEIKNPTNLDCYFIFKGQKYTVEANSSTKNVPEEVAMEWVGTIHQFLKKSKQTSVKAEEVKEEVVDEPVLETPEEVKAEEVIVEAPKTSKK